MENEIRAQESTSGRDRTPAQAVYLGQAGVGCFFVHDFFCRIAEDRTMKRESAPNPGPRFSSPEALTAALDRLEKRLDGIADRLNAVWDRVVQGDESGARQDPPVRSEP